MARMMLMKKLGEFLTRTGFIFTVRKYKMREKDVMVDRVGSCRRVPAGQITNIDELAPYLPFSGFENLDEWWEAIEYFIKPGEPKYLYKVVLIEQGRML